MKRLAMDREHPDLDLLDGEADEEPIGVLRLSPKRYGVPIGISIPVDQHQEEVDHPECRDDVR